MVINITYSYSIVERSAKAVQESMYWIENDKIKKMKFSNKWIKGFLSRGSCTRRKITREDKEVPTDIEIASVLNIGQQKYIENNHTAKTCYNVLQHSHGQTVLRTYIAQSIKREL